jgi:hypothetical protein
MAKNTPADLPPHLAELLAMLPANVTRQAGAQIITKNLFPVSHRSLERWSLPIRHVIAQAWAKLNAAPIMMSGLHATAETAEHGATQ